MRLDNYFTHITLTKVSTEEEANLDKLKKSLSVWDEGYFTYSFCAFMEDTEKDMLIIPSGYDFYKLKHMLPNIKSAYSHRAQADANPYRTVKDYDMVNEPRNLKQVQAINYLKNRNDKYYAPQKYLSLPTGEGKTYCVIAYCQYSKKLPIIFVDQESLLKQWKSAIMEHTNVEAREIYTISGMSSINKLLKMDEEQLGDLKYVIAIHRTFHNLSPSKIQEVFDYVKFGIKIFDEAHVEWKNICYIDFLTNVETIYVSATPEKSNPSEQKVYNNIFSSISKYKVERKDDEKFLNGMVYSINTHSSLKNQTEFVNKKGFDIIGYSKYFLKFNCAEEVINDLLPKIFNGNFNKKKKVVLVFKLIDQLTNAKELVEDLLEKNNCELSVNILDGKTKDKEEVMKNSDILITTEKSFMKGIDIKGLEYMINFVPIGSKTNLIQLAGRLREHPEGKKVFFIDVVDISVSDLVGMKNKRISTYKKLCKIIYTMNGPSCRKVKESE